MSTRVYQYALRAPVEGASLAEEQLWRAHRYQHTLTTIERARRRCYVAARRRCVGDLDLAERVAETARGWLAYAREHVSRLHSERRSKRTPPEIRARVDALRATSRECGARVKALKVAAREHEGLCAEAAAIEERALLLRKAARATCGVYWGTYLLVEQACDQARRSSADPGYRRIVSQGYLYADDRVGDGQLGVQVQGGMPAASLMGADPRVRLDPLPATQWDTRPGRRRARTRLWLRVGTGDGREPLWAVWPMMMHRPLPEQAIVKRVNVTRRVSGLRVRWTCEVTIDVPDAPQTPNPRPVAVHLGWRSRPGGGVRVAYLADEEGRSEEVLLAPSVLGLIERERTLRSTIADLRNLAITYLRAWLAAEPRVPDWLRQRTAHVAQRRQDRRLAQLVEHWRARRFEGDSRMYTLLAWWRHRWRHLYQWATGCARRIHLVRREQYRVLAERLCTQYGTVVMDDADYRDLARRLPAEQADEEAHAIARLHRRAASPGELRAIVEQCARGRGLAFRVAPAADLSTTCHECGGTCEYDARARLTHRCEHCGALWDQDECAARNLLGCERSCGTRDPAAARKPRKTGRFAKLADGAGAATPADAAQ